MFGLGNFNPVSYKPFVEFINIFFSLKVESYMEVLGIAYLRAFHQVDVHVAAILENSYAGIIVFEHVSIPEMLFQECTGSRNITDSEVNVIKFHRLASLVLICSVGMLFLPNKVISVLLHFVVY